MIKYDLFIQFKKDRINFLIIKIKENEIQTEDIKDSIILVNTDIENNLSNLISKKISEIENTIKFNFKDCILLLPSEDLKIIKATSFKENLNNQITKKEVQFNLNNLKSVFDEQERIYKLIHIFNSRFIVDDQTVYNLPLNKFCKNFKQENTFIYLLKNRVKNYAKIINECNLNIKKLFLSDYALASSLTNKFLLNKKNYINVFLKRKSISFFNMQHNSLVDVGTYKFGSDIIYKDIEKICSINFEEVKDIINNIEQKGTIIKTNQYNHENKKITHEFIVEIGKARIEEILKIILSNFQFNINKNKKDFVLYLFFEDLGIKNFFKSAISNTLINNLEINLFPAADLNDQFRSCRSAANIYYYGWESEAIPVIPDNTSGILKFLRKLIGI